MFWPTFTCQILIKFSFLESLWHKETDCTSFAKKFLQIICKQPVKGNLHILVFLNYTSGYLKFCKTFCIFEMAWSRAFQKCIIFYFLDNFFFANIFTLKLDFAKKSSIFANFFSDSKSRAQELSNDVSFFIFGHQTWDSEGVGQIDSPPCSISWFSSTSAGIGYWTLIILLRSQFHYFKQISILKLKIF